MPLFSRQLARPTGLQVQIAVNPRQMRAFCTLIVAQTGLSLYDLSKGMPSREVKLRERGRSG